MSDTKSTPYFTVALVTVAVGFAAYAVYFDHKRRNNAEFRKKLKKEKKRVQKALSQSKESVPDESAVAVNLETLKDAIQQIKNEPPPQTPEERETYFLAQVGLGEQLSHQGPKFQVPAAIAFFRALRVYPSPVELIVIYQKTVAEPIFNLVMQMTNLDVKDRIEGYYNYFPPARTNVSVKNREPVPGQGVRNVLVVNKDFAAGEVIYKEFPVVTALDPDLHAKGTYCEQCLRPIEPGLSLDLKDSNSSTFPSVYCSKACMLTAKTQHQSLLFSADSVLPPDIPAAPPVPGSAERRRESQVRLVEYLARHGQATPLLVARFISRIIAAETSKMADLAARGANKPNPSSTAISGSDFTDSDTQTGDTYTLSDHIERLRYLEVVHHPEECSILADVLRGALPGLEEFVTEERHAILSGKMAYNAFGVCYGGGRDNRPQPEQRPETLAKTRTPYGTDRQVGSALYTLSSYLTHSCQPSARPSFSSGTAEISIIANRDLQAGDELSIAFVDVSQRPGETAADSRKRRRKDLARGWRFACVCERCTSEAAVAPALGSEGGIDETMKDESKTEDSLARYQANKYEEQTAQGADGGVE